MTDTQQYFVLFGIHTGLALMLSLMFMLFTKTENRSLIVIMILFFFFTMAILYVPDFPFLAKFKLNWNWQGKAITCLLAFAFVYLLPFLSAKEAGFTFKVNKSVWLPFFILTAISVAYNVYPDSYAIGDRTKEYLLFEFTMPGFSEETIFRGVLLGLLNLVFVSRRIILGASIGWGALIITILFGAGHALYFDGNHHIQFQLSGFTITFILGCIMAYLKEKGESIVPSLLFHNIFNAFPAFLRLFF